MLDRYLDLVNNILPSRQGYPVRFNHCFARIILDNVCGQCWKNVIKSPAYKNMTDEQLKRAVKLGEAYLVNPNLCREHNFNSLRWRGKL